MGVYPRILTSQRGKTWLTLPYPSVSLSFPSLVLLSSVWQDGEVHPTLVSGFFYEWYSVCRWSLFFPSIPNRIILSMGCSHRVPHTIITSRKGSLWKGPLITHPKQFVNEFNNVWLHQLSMKSSGKCPKCGSEDVIIPKMLKRVLKHIVWKSDEYNCQNCGYVEVYRTG